MKNVKRDYDMLDALTVVALTIDLDTHPAGYHGACICNTCHALRTL